MPLFTTQEITIIFIVRVSLCYNIYSTTAAIFTIGAAFSTTAAITLRFRPSAIARVRIARHTVLQIFIKIIGVVGIISAL